MFDKLPDHMFAWISMRLAKKTKRPQLSLLLSFLFSLNFAPITL